MELFISALLHVKFYHPLDFQVRSALHKYISTVESEIYVFFNIHFYSKIVSNILEFSNCFL